MKQPKGSIHVFLIFPYFRPHWQQATNHSVTASALGRFGSLNANAAPSLPLVAIGRPSRHPHPRTRPTGWKPFGTFGTFGKLRAGKLRAGKLRVFDLLLRTTDIMI